MRRPRTEPIEVTDEPGGVKRKAGGAAAGAWDTATLADLEAQMGAAWVRENVAGGRPWASAASGQRGVWRGGDGCNDRDSNLAEKGLMQFRVGKISLVTRRGGLWIGWAASEPYRTTSHHRIKHYRGGVQ